MVPFDECPVCETLPRRLFAFLTSEPGQRREPEHEFPGDPATERLETVVPGCWLRRCPLCGTTYQYNRLDRGWPSGSRQNYLYRLTPTKLRRLLSMSPQGSPQQKELRALEARLPELAEAASRLLSSPKGEAREHAAESLVDDLKTRKLWKGVRELLVHPDARVRLGALRSFEPFHFYAVDVGFGPLVPDFVSTLSDPDPDVSHAAKMLLWDRPAKESRVILGRLRRVPPRERSVALRDLLVEITDTLPEMVLGLADPDFGVRRHALNRLHRFCWRDSDAAARAKEAIRALGASPATESMEEFLADEEAHWRAYGDDD